MPKSMKAGKLFDLLSRLSEEEQVQFGQFLDSPLFNTQKNFVFFYQLYKQHILESPEEEEPEEGPFKALVRKEKDWSKAYYRKIKSELRNLAKSFLIYKDHSQETALPELQYFFAVNNRLWDDLVPDAYEVALKKFEEMAPLGLDALHLKAQMMRDYNSYNQRQPRKTGVAHLLEL